MAIGLRSTQLIYGAVPYIANPRGRPIKRKQVMRTSILNTKNKGFTLIELLVVIAIIGILASMLLPALAKSKKRALRVKCLGNLKQISSAFQAFADDNKQRLPWQLTQQGQGTHFGADGAVMDTSTIYSIAS
ncbi:uncharacterized protein METZ01_LOCUS429304, partial [marine metagenome]